MTIVTTVTTVRAPLGRTTLLFARNFPRLNPFQDPDCLSSAIQTVFKCGYSDYFGQTALPWLFTWLHIFW